MTSPHTETPELDEDTNTTPRDDPENCDSGGGNDDGCEIEGNPFAQRDREDLARRPWVFVELLLVSMFINFDSGALPASLLEVEKAFDMNFFQLGMLGAGIYLFFSLSSPLVGHWLQIWSPKQLLAASLVGYATFSLVFATSPDVVTLIVARAVLGIFQSCAVIFAPVWVDDFAPEKRRALWMSILQAAPPLGIMIGYLMGGLIVRYSDGSWRISFIIQAVVLFVLACILLWIPRRLIQMDYVDVDTDAKKTSPEEETKSNVHFARIIRYEEFTPVTRAQLVKELQMRRFSFLNEEGIPGGAPVSHSRGRSLSFARRQVHDALVATIAPSTQKHVAKEEPAIGEEPPPSPRPGFLHQFKQLMRCPIYWSVALAVSALYYVVTGIQYWITSYLVDELHQDLSHVVIAFSLATATGPTIGVLFGGWFIDRLGGYRGKNGVYLTLRVCFIFALLGNVLGIPAGFAKTLWGVIPLLWGLLFFGGAIVPPATGVLLSSVPSSMRAFASAFAQLSYHFLGYFLSPFLTGVIMEGTGFTWGVRIVLMWGIWGVFFLGVGFCLAGRAAKGETRQCRLWKTESEMTLPSIHEEEEGIAMEDVEVMAREVTFSPIPVA